MVQRLLGSADLVDDERLRLQRRFAAICDAMKAPGADTARGAWRLERFLADLAGNPVTDEPADRTWPAPAGPSSAAGSAGAGPD
jgi:hypothetical protein